MHRHDLLQHFCNVFLQVVGRRLPYFLNLGILREFEPLDLLLDLSNVLT